MIQQTHDRRSYPVMQSLLLLLAIVGCTGCGLTRETQRVVDLARRTTFLEPRFYDYVRSDKLAQREARLLAEQAWGEVSATVPNASPDYQNGFTEGFADYLYRGGEGEPPLIPPRGYWNLRFLNQFGKLSTNDWYEGFRHGAQNCKSSGLREMWLVPTSLLTGESNDLPKSQEQLRSADPAAPMIQPTPDVSDRKQTGREADPPIPDSRPVMPKDVDDDVGNAKPTDGQDDPDTSDADDFYGLDDLSDLVPSTNTDPPTKDASDPFGNDPLTPNDLTPDIELPAEGSDVDVFQVPEGAFDSSESFEPDVDPIDFDFQSNHSNRDPNAPLAIRAIRPATKIPKQATHRQTLAPIVLASGEYEQDLPPAPDGTPLLMSTDRAPAPPTSKPMPRGRPRMQPRPRNDNSLRSARVYDAQPMTPSPANAQTHVAPMRYPIAPTKTVAGQRRRHELAKSKQIQRERAQRSPAPRRPVAPGNNLPLSKVALDPADSSPPPPLTLVPRPPSSNSDPAPTVVWLSDELPSRPEPIPTISDGPIVIGSDEWQPFAEVDSEQFNFDAPRYQGVLDEQAMQRSTRWAPQRESELPLLIGSKPQHRTATNPSPQNRLVQNPISKPPSVQDRSTPDRMVIQPAPQSAYERNLKIREPNESQTLPRIYLQQPATQIIRPTSESSTPISDTDTSWRFRD